MNVRTAFVFVCGILAADDDAGRILKPTDKAALPAGPVEVIATGPAAMIQIDGAPIRAEHPFPNVLHARVEVSPGVHTIRLSWSGGRKEIQFYTGLDRPAGFESFREHPRGQTTRCTQCHELSRRGRFAFKGGCFACHAESGFAKTHTHAADVLRECGLCHNAHGSTAASHLLYTKEIALQAVPQLTGLLPLHPFRNAGVSPPVILAFSLVRYAMVWHDYVPVIA